MAQQSEKFESIVKHLKKLNEAESVVKQKLTPSGKLTTPAIQVQPKMDPEVEGAAAGIEGHGVKDKSEEYLKKSEEYLKNIDKTLKNIQDSFAKSNSASGKSDNESNKSGSTGKLPDLPKDYTLTEGLKSTVGMAKSIGKGIAGFASNPKKTLSNAFGSVKDSVKGALGTAKDIVSAEAGYTPERERFAKGYAASAKGTQFQKGGKSALDAGKDKYDALKAKEDEINKVKEKMDVPASQGFSPLKKDQKELDKLNKEFDALDPRVTAASPTADKQAKADALTTPEIDKSPNEKITAASVNPESDNIETSGELISKEIKETNDLIGQNLSIVKLQLEELKGIRLALTPATADEPNKDPNKRVVEKLDELIEAVKEGGGGGGGGGGLGLTDLIPSGGKAAAGGKLASRMASLGKAAKIGGAVLAVGAGAYTAYKGYTEAEDNKQAKMDEVQAKVDSGEMKPEEAAAARKEIGNTATVEKSGAIGEGTGMAAGAIAGGLAGAKLGGTIGTFIGGPVGTAVGAGIGGLAGGALGAFAGSSAGKYVGEKAGEGINYLKDKAGGIGSAVSGFFGSKKEEAAPGAAAAAAMGGAPAVAKQDKVEFKKSKVLQEKIGGSTIAGYEDGYELQGKKEDVEAAEAAWKKFGKAESNDDKAGMDAAANEFIQLANKINSPEYKAKMKEISDKQNKKKEEKVSGGPGAKNPVGDVTASKTASQSTDAVAGAAGASISKTESYTTIAGERVVPNQPLSDKQMAVIGMSKASGNTYSPDVEAQYAKQKQVAAVEPKTTGNTAGPEVVKASTENADLNREASRGSTNVTPIVSNNSSTNNNTSYVPVKPTPRNERGGSALDRYQDRVSAF